MAKFFSEELEAAKSVLDSWSKIMEFFQTAEGPGGEKFNQEADVPGAGYELWWFDERVLSVGNLLLSLESVEIDSGAPLPESFISELTAASNQFKNSIDKLSSHVKQAGDGEINALTPSNWVVQLAPGNQQINFASLLQNLKSEVENCLVKYYAVASIVRTDKFSAFAEAVREFSEKAATVRENTKAVEKAKSEIEVLVGEITKLKSDGVSDKDAIAGLLEKSQELAITIGEAQTESSASLEKIQEIEQTADELNKEVEAYRETFTTFQASLDENNTAFENWSEKTKKLFSELTDKDKDIGATIERANDMLKGATNAGLATTFSKTLEDLETKLASAKSAFHWAIGLLTLSAIPLGAYLIMASLDLSPDQSSKVLFAFRPGNLSPATTLALALLMVPTIWLTKFAAARHHQLFQLKEHYQYKYTLAMAVDGFKKQAPTHADEIAAETFFQLSFNPADKLTGKGGAADHPSPLMNWIMNKLGLNDKGAKE